MGLAVGDRARAFKGLSPGMLPPLGIIFGTSEISVGPELLKQVIAGRE